MFHRIGKSYKRQYLLRSGVEIGALELNMRIELETVKFGWNALRS